MKRKLHSLALLFAGVFSQLLSAQVAPVVSSAGDTTWYYIESAKTQAVTTIGSIPTDNLKNYVIYSPASDGNVLYRLRTYADAEKWAIVNVGGINKLYNKATKKYLTASYQVNGTGEQFKWVNYSSTMQYKISTSSYNPLIAYSNFTCNRNTDLGVNSQGAWFFKKVADTPAPQVPRISLAGDTTWYYIESAKSSSVANLGTTPMKDFKDYVLYSPASGSSAMYRLVTYTDAEKWAIINVGGVNKLYNKGTKKYLAGSYQINTTGEEFKWNNYAGTLQYYISTASYNPMIAWDNLTCNRYSNQTANSQTAWYFWPVSSWIPTNQALSQVSVSQGSLVTGIGNKDFAVVYFDAQVSGGIGQVTAQSVKLNLNGTTNLNDIENLRIYKTTSLKKFNPLTDIQVASGAIVSGNFDVTFTSPLTLSPGDNFFCVVVDIKSTANEGGLVDASVVSVQPGSGNAVASFAPSPANSATVFLTQSTLFSPGDYGSVSYRIPAIVTAKDGSLITSTDKRNNNSGDLPNNIDQYVRRSTDNGKTWSNVLMTCGASTTLGYGDPALAVDRVTGKIICLVVHDKGFFGSTAAAPIRVIMMESNDNGVTWSSPNDITDQLYGANCSNPVTKTWAGIFISSGRGLQLRNGRIMFAGVVRDGVNSALQVHTVYTDDLGATWNVSTNSAINGGDESKFAERNNGDVIVSVRKAPKRYWNISNNSGISWGTASQHADLTDPACNGEILAYTSTLDGFDKNRMLHSLCYAGNRTNVSMLLSYDEGNSYPIRKTICPASSAYSTFTILADGTIGMYFEDGSVGNTYDMQFVRFSLDWLTNGTDSYMSASKVLKSTDLKRIQAFEENGKVIVTGSDAIFRVFNSSGMEVSPKAKLKAGVYVVRVDGSAVKLIVK